MNKIRIRRLLDELQRELATEEAFGSADIQLATQVVGLKPLELQPDPRRRSQTLIARPERVCRPYRLVISTADPSWWVTRCEAGGSHLLPSAGSVRAAAFTPLPPWMIDAPDPANVPEPEHLRLARKEWPLSNIEPIALWPGLLLTVELEWDRFDTGPTIPNLPPAWLLAHVPQAMP